jgi:hypothetical protein
MWFHNLRNQAAGVEFRTRSGTLIAFREIAAERPSIVHYRQNTIALFVVCDLCFLLRPRLLLVGPARTFLVLSGGEALRLFTTNGALPNVISTVIVPHRRQYSPACRGLATEPMDTDIEGSKPDWH